jgi:predicted porin
MKKSLIALAVASAVAAPAFAATSNVDVYGTVRMSVENVDAPAGDTFTITDRVSRIGFKGSEDLGGGLKAIWQIEQQINATGSPLSDTNAITATSVSSGGITTTTTGTHPAGAFGGAGMRNTFVGLSGGFGTALIGRHDAPYKLGGSADLFGDTAADAQQSRGIIGSGNFDLRVNGTIAYVSPTWSGFHFAVATVPGETAIADGLMDAYSLVGVYANGPLKATLSYQMHDKDILAAAADESAWKANVGYKMGDLSFGATYEKQDNVAGTAGRDKDAWLVSAAYAMGPITLKAQFGDRDDDVAANDLERWTIGADYALSKRTGVYALYNADDANGVDTDTFSVGINHSF